MLQHKLLVKDRKIDYDRGNSITTDIFFMCPLCWHNQKK